MPKFICLLILWLAASKTDHLSALDIVGHVGSVEVGDDRPNGIAGITFSKPTTFAAGIFGFGYKQGPVRQSNILTHVSHPVQVKGYDLLSLQIGGAISQTLTKISRSQGSLSKESFNLGVHFGLDVTIPVGKHMKINGGWHSFVFPAGLSSILLVSARKQALMMGVGVSL